MAFMRVEPVDVQVRTDWFDGRPREIRWGHERLPVIALASVREEACPHDLAPTTSTTVALALGDALAVTLLEVKGFRRARRPGKQQTQQRRANQPENSLWLENHRKSSRCFPGALFAPLETQ